MSLFQCEECGTRENSACTYGYHLCEVKKCSECNDGKWHDRFPKLYLPMGKFKTNRVGNLEHIDTGQSPQEWLESNDTASVNT